MVNYTVDVQLEMQEMRLKCFSGCQDFLTNSSGMVAKVGQHLHALFDYLVGLPTFNVGDNAYTAAIVFLLR